MIILLSPAKTINYKPVDARVPLTKSEFFKQASELVDTLRTQNLQKTLGVSEKLAELNAERFAAWSANAQPPQAERAAWAYRGEVYFGLSAESLSPEQLTFANNHVRIISGLYGLLRITDAIMPYRLEMKTALKGAWGKNLYDFWGSQLNNALLELQPSFVLNCASQEYLKAVQPHLPDTLRIVTPSFLHDGPTGTRPKMAFSKYSRGLMARWAIEKELLDPSVIPYFDVEGYRFDAERSTPDKPVFIAPPNFTIKGRFTKL